MAGILVADAGRGFTRGFAAKKNVHVLSMHEAK
jgi:hypothetical protein